MLGFEMGSRFGFAGYGQLTMLLMTSETAFQGFQFGVKYQALTYLYGEIALIPGSTAPPWICTPSHCRRSCAAP